MGGGHAYERNVRRRQILKIGQEGYSKENRQNTKPGTSIVVYNLRDLKVFCNTGILGKSIVIYDFTVCCFYFEHLSKDGLINYPILFEYPLKTSVNQIMICISLCLLFGR